METEITDLKEVLTMAMAQYREEAVRREIDIKISAPETMAPLYAPREAVHRVLSNLIENAIHHTLHSGRIDIEFADGDDYVDITVQDYGAGIAESDLPYIFEKYYRSNNAGYSAQGTNLGLAITRMLVKAMAGQIWVTSDVGKGACFKVMLPRRLGSQSDAAINESRAQLRNETLPDAPATI
jgi:signal transduction histidine kinase